MSTELIKIDTKEMCLLCYNRCDRNRNHTRSSSLPGFKQLLRYLNVDTKQLFNCSPEFLQWMEINHEISVQVTLCTNCSLVTEQFDKLYKEYEQIQVQFDKCVASLHQSMISGDSSPDLVQEFKTLMRPQTAVDLINASVAANLRSQTFKKCLLKLPDTHSMEFEPNESQNEAVFTSVKINSRPNNVTSPAEFVLPVPSPSPSLDETFENKTYTICVKRFPDDNHLKLDDVSLNEDEAKRQTKHRSKFRRQKRVKRKTNDISDLNEPASIIRPQKKKKIFRSTYQCEYCPYTANQSSNLRYHKLGTHTVEAVLPHLETGTCRVKCGHGVETIMNEFMKGGNKCPKCGAKFATKQILRLHILGQHFDDIVVKVKNYFEQSAANDEGGMEFEETEFTQECVKLEVIDGVCPVDPLDSE